MFKVQRTRILGTDTVVYRAWEPTQFIGGKHHTITTFDGVWFGLIGSDPDPSVYNHLPVGPERTAKVGEAYQARYQLAHQLIRNAFPEAAALGNTDNGEIEVRDPVVVFHNKVVTIEG